jgi:hypothetical protein
MDNGIRSNSLEWHSDPRSDLRYDLGRRPSVGVLDTKRADQGFCPRPSILQSGMMGQRRSVPCWGRAQRRNPSQPPPVPYSAPKHSVSVPNPFPLGFILPYLPSPRSKPPSGSAWIHEMKHDGYRLMVRRDGKRIRLFTRHSYDWSKRYPLIADALGSLWVRSHHHRWRSGLVWGGREVRFRQAPLPRLR